MMRERFSAEWAALNLPKGAGVTVALSGGPDSVALLSLLKELQSPDFRLQAAHVNHGLRGDNALRDQRFCEELCQKWQIPLKVFEGDAAAYGAERGMSPEEGARALRYQFLEPLANGQDSFVVTAHHRGDQQETFWINLYRGSGSTGLRGMRERRGGYLRPLLSFDRAELLEYLKNKELTFVQDETNEDPAYLRNFLRHQVLPLMNSRPEGDLQKGLAASMECLAEEDEALNQWAASVTDDRTDTLAKLPAAVLKRVLDRMLGEPLSRFHFTQIRQILQQNPPSAQLQLPEGRVFRLEYGRCCFPLAVEDRQFSVTPDQPVDCGDRTFILRSKEIHNPFTHSLLNYGKIGNNLILRHKMPGDRFSPVGKKGTTQLLKRLKNDRVPRSRRDALWILAEENGRILWVEDYGADQSVAAQKNDTVLYAEIRRKGEE